MNQAFYTGGKIIANLNARIVGNFLYCCRKCGRWRSVLFLVLIVWITQLCSNTSLLLITKSNKESTYCDCSGKICNYFNCSVHKSLLLIFVIVLIILFCSLNILLLIAGVPPEYYTIRHYGVKIRKVNHFQWFLWHVKFKCPDRIMGPTQFIHEMIQMDFPYWANDYKQIHPLVTSSPLSQVSSLALFLKQSHFMH